MSHREEALTAIETLEKLLIQPTLSQVDRRIALTMLDHAREHVLAIEELKRKRRKPTP